MQKPEWIYCYPEDGRTYFLDDSGELMSCPTLANGEMDFHDGVIECVAEYDAPLTKREIDIITWQLTGNKHRMKKAVEEAQEAFWGVINKKYPEIKSGDFCWDMQARLDDTMLDAVRHVISGNTTVDEEVVQNAAM